MISPVRGHGSLTEFCRARAVCVGMLLVFLLQPGGAFGQEQTGGPAQVTPTPQEHQHSEAITSLQDLLAEGERNNPQIEAARQAWEAAKQVPSQVSTLPDPPVVCCPSGKI